MNTPNRNMYKFIVLIPLFLLFASCKQQFESLAGHRDSFIIVLPKDPAARVEFGAKKLAESLENAGYNVNTIVQNQLPAHGKFIVVGELNDSLFQEAIKAADIMIEKSPGKEGFSIATGKHITVIGGADASGTLYGCMEMAERIRDTRKFPAVLKMTDQPEMVLRGTNIGLQKTKYLPGRNVYEYPYTPENFPWFYDKELWIEYLDMLVENRMNSLYLWNGHPFASLVKLEVYPYAVEVDDETFKKNEEIFRFLTKEADKRGIWVIQMFYNIIISKPFAEAHGLETQDRSRPIIPVIADYTRKSIAAFVEKYPNVGLLITLGEAMDTETSDVPWFTETIIPGVKDGLKALGTNVEPPIVLRGHDTNPQLVMQKALPLYQNLYTMNKYNGEALTTYQPRGPWAQMHRELSELGSTHIDNVHILANLEPFRYGSANFIQKSVQAMHAVHGANGLHVYPESSYWDWPYTADKAEPRLLQIERDWVWYKAWGRYAWNCQRDRQQEITYWSQLFDREYGCGKHGADILEAYEQAGEISPKILRRFGITNGNRQTLTLGMFMSQLVNPDKWRVWPHLYDSDGPEGETLLTYAEKEWKQQNHVGETPPQITNEVVEHGQLAVDAIEKAAQYITKNQAAFKRLKNDMYCHAAMAYFYDEKVKAALWVLQYGYSNDIADLERAVSHLEKSIEHYRELVSLTKDAYLYANSMQTAQRRVPIGGDDGKNKTWEELLPHYIEELSNFKNNIKLLRLPKKAVAGESKTTPLNTVNVLLLHPDEGYYPIEAGQHAFIDEAFFIKDMAEELKGLKGIRFSMKKQIEKGSIIRFKNDRPVKVLVGYFQSGEEGFLAPPDLETDATANAHGQAEIKIENALLLPGLPPVNVHSYHFNRGNHSLNLGKGACLILGFTDGTQEITTQDAGFTAVDYRKGVDWLFY